MEVEVASLLRGIDATQKHATWKRKDISLGQAVMKGLERDEALVSFSSYFFLQCSFCVWWGHGCLHWTLSVRRVFSLDSLCVYSRFTTSSNISNWPSWSKSLCAPVWRAGRGNDSMHSSFGKQQCREPTWSSGQDWPRFSRHIARSVFQHLS